MKYGKVTTGGRTISTGWMRGDYVGQINGFIKAIRVSHMNWAVSELLEMNQLGGKT